MSSTSTETDARAPAKPVEQVGDRVFANLALGAGVLILVVLAGVAAFRAGALPFNGIMETVTRVVQEHGTSAFVAALDPHDQIDPNDEQSVLIADAAQAALGRAFDRIEPALVETDGELFLEYAVEGP